jgi:SP family general alpha glucoside:H+ symporter-like MFS transporter
MAATVEDPAAGVIRADNYKIANEMSNYNEVVHDAALADTAEHNMGVREAFRIHKKAVMWSVLLSAALIMEGYDVVVVSLISIATNIPPSLIQIASFYAQPAFLKRFGVADPATGELGIPADWQAGLGNGSR